MAANGISTLATKAERQIAKLELAQTKRQLTGTAGYRALRYYDANLLPARYQENSTVFTPHPGGLQQGRPWKTTPNVLSGLWRSQYNGYFDGDWTWFDTQTPIASIQVNDFTFPDGGDSYQWLGYFRAPHTANYTFYLESDDRAQFWLGDKAITEYDDGNWDVFSDAGEGESSTDPISLTAGQYYPIRLQYGDAGGTSTLNFKWSDDYAYQLVTSGMVVQLDPADYATTPSPGTWVNRQNFPSFNAGTTSAPTYHTIDIVSFQYDGSEQFWNLEPNPTSGDFTASIWFNTMSNVGTGTHFYDNPTLIGGDVAGVANDWGLAIANGRIGFGAVSGQTVFTTSQYNDGNWHCATATRIAPTGVMNIYVDGVLQGTMTEAPGVNLTSSPKLYIGADPTNGQPYTGYIGEVDFWQIALTAEQIATNFEAQRGVYGA